VVTCASRHRDALTVDSQPLRGALDNLAGDLRDLGWSEERIRQELAQVLAAASEWPL
jgi:hypothetical protein